MALRTKPPISEVHVQLHHERSLYNNAPWNSGCLQCDVEDDSCITSSLATESPRRQLLVHQPVVVVGIVNDAGDSQHPFPSNGAAINSDFCLNAPRPDDGEEHGVAEANRTIHSAPPSTSVHIRSSNNNNGSMASYTVGSPRVAPDPLTNGVQSTSPSQVSQRSKRSGLRYRQLRSEHEFFWRKCIQRRWKSALLTIVVESILLLAAISVIIFLALNRANVGRARGGDASVVDSSVSTTSTLKSIRERGNLACGVVEYPGLSSFNSTTGNWQGFEVDLCRAVGAAIFGTDGEVTFNNMTNGERFNVLQSGKVDLLAARVTYTMERDLYEPTERAGFSFSTPYLYNGLSFGGPLQYVACAEQQNTTGSCSTLTICVQDNTTHVQVVQSLFPRGSVIKLAPTTKNFYINFQKGYCTVLAGDQFDLAETNVKQVGYTGNYSISNNLYSKEPIALVTRDDDASWSDFVNWVFLALLTAENRRITQAIAQSVVDNPAPSVDTSQISFYRAVATVGNYAEMYNRHLESIVPRAPVNQQNKGETPLIYSFPFGNSSNFGPGPMANGTLEKILQRGYLRCGNAAAPFSANFNMTTQQWEGFDVAYCRAVSAAIFNGTGSTVFVPVTGTNRWELLASGEIDLLSWDTTWNYLRDVNETRTGKGFSFTIPNFYTGIQFGGIPTFQTCAESVDVFSGQCSGLKLCVSNGTTAIDNLRRLFPEKYISAQADDQKVVDCLSSNKGNVIAADGFWTATGTVREKGYNGSYLTNTKLFSRENLAMVTRQDDPQWSSFVNWVVMATFYAEEQNITQATFDLMPTTNIFGPRFTSTLQNVILSVGSRAEIFARNARGKYEISAINRLNTNPFGPQHFPPSGLFGLY